MSFRKRNSILLMLLLFFTASASGNLAQSKGKRPSSSRTILFEVTGGDASLVDPIVILDRGRYIKPPEGVEADVKEGVEHFSDRPDSTQFAAQYYRPGQTYRLLFGGGRVGTATVTKRTSSSCTSLAASVSLQTSVKLGGWVRALATNSDALGSQESSRRAPSPDERSAVLELVKRTYRQRGITAPLLKKITVTNLTAVDLDRDGQAELVGSFRIEQGEKAYLLFLIVGKRAGNYKIELQHYDQGLESGEDFIDQLDLDGDGIGEVITQVSGYETFDYAIYKKRAGRWQRVYRGGGGGC